MEIAGHLWQFLTKNKTLRLRNHHTVTCPLADYICGQKSPVINRNHSGIFLF